MDKIIFMTFEFPPALIGGIGRVAFDKLRQFEKYDYEIYLIAPNNGEQIKIGPNTKLLPLPVTGNVQKFFKTLIYSISICRKNKIKFLYCLSGTYIGLAGYIIKRLFSVNYFTNAHGNEFIRFSNNRLISIFLRKIYNSSNKVFVVSNFTAEKLIEFGVNKNVIATTYNGVNINEFYPEVEQKLFNKSKELGITNKKFKLITISRLDMRKGHLNVIQALRVVATKRPKFLEDCIYLIGGRGPEKDNILSSIVKNKLESMVKYLGFINDEDLNTLYSLADVFIMPSVYLEDDGSFEGFGIVYLEAGACGTMSIGGATGGATDAIDDGNTGIVIDGENNEELQNAIINLYDNMTKVEKLSKAAYKRSIGEYNIDTIFKNELSIIKNNL